MTANEAIKQHLERLEALSDAERQRYLQNLDGQDPTLAAALRPLAAELDAPSCPPGVSQALNDLLQTGRAPRPGQALGPWTLDRELGRGGMGVVYLAHRSDGQYERQVAIKLFDPAMLAGTGRPDLMAEVRVLARLNHPHIAQLFEAGLGPAGEPYLVMEWVPEALTLTQYARQQGLPPRERVRLMLQLCAAVQHAHHHLVIHRDLKPGNVLVSADGQVHLLDFGIARLLDADPELTQNLPRYTPAYASPEQLALQPLTTASDVFSLGVLLFELLCDQHPFRRDGEPAGAYVARMLGEQPQPAWPRQPPLDGDLRAIVAQALRTDPADRTASVDALAADLQAWLEQRPVQARGPSWRYRSGRFLQRHRWLVGASSLGLAGTLGFAVHALQSAREAEAQRTLAEARLSEVRGFARQVIHDYDALLQPLPGTLPARQRIVGDALAYLDRQRRSPQLPAEFGLELADSYLAIGSVQGAGLAGPGLGDFEQAARSFAVAREFYEPACRSATLPPELLGRACFGLAEALERRAQVDAISGRADAAIQALNQSLLQLQSLDKAGPDATRHRQLLVRQADVLNTLASLESRASGALWAQAVSHAGDGVRALRELQQADPQPQVREQLAFMLDLQAFLLSGRGDAEAGLQAIGEALLIARELHAAMPNRNTRILLSTTTQTEGELLHLQGRHAQGAASLRQASDLAEALYREEPENVQALHGLLMSSWRQARGERRAGQAALALATAQGALRLAQRQAALPPFAQANLHHLQREAALALLASGRAADATPLARRALDGFLQLQGERADRQLTVLATTRLALAQALQAGGQPAAAQAQRQAAAADLQRWLALTPADGEARALLAQALGQPPGDGPPLWRQAQLL
ncbi:MAG: hypothetical protein DI603_04150 [Roseateles depolymerans]|uniref:Protein kinase domain-containing protein n=1 Tax=Roseateles depolymerans TaxID=76731 RepID=A0A2W5FVK4_9BURK|nr:MAG: hypothetical protein DI603_04150 [Roseateles depolymerans]